MKPLFLHQEIAAKNLDTAFKEGRSGFGLSIAMRGGKTRISIEFIKRRSEENLALRAVIVSPASVRKNWQREFRKWTNLEATLVSPGKKIDLEGPGIYVTSYELLKKFVGGPSIDILCLDEAHMISSDKSLRSKAVRAVIGENTFVVALTGTLIPNQIRDLWNPVDVVTPGLLGSFGSFIVRYSNKIPNEYSPSGFVYSGLNQARAEELKQRMAPHWQRTVKQDFAHLLPKFDVVPRYVTPKRKKFDWDDEAVFEELLAANSPLKLDTMMEVLDEAIEGGQKKFCVAAWLHQTVDQIVGLCKARGWEVFQVDGRVGSDGRLEILDAWRNEKRIGVLVAGIGAVGIGLSLSASETSVMVEIPWRPSDLDQFVNRFNDAEHDHPGLVVPIVVEGSREERAINRYVTKRDDIDLLVAVSSTEAQAKKAFERGESDEDILKGLGL